MEKIYNGYDIREAIRRYVTRRDLAAKMFEESIWAFPGDHGTKKPESEYGAFVYADNAVALLETLQQTFNQQVKVDVMGEKITLALAVKLIGGAGRGEKMWKGAIVTTGRARYDDAKVRLKDSTYAVKQVSADKALHEATMASQRAAALRAAIAAGNAVKLKVSDQKLIDILDK